MKRWHKAALVLAVIGVLVYFGFATGFLDSMIRPPQSGLKGPIYFYGEALSTDDTTDIDGAGTIEFWTGSAPYSLIEPALTMGTDTHTTLEYASGNSMWVVVKSTTANAMDHFSYKVDLPAIGKSGQGPLYTVEWSDADENWILTLKGGQESAPDVVVYDPDNVAVGSTSQDLSNNDYVLNFDCVITTQANYDGLFAFFDPDEGDGEWDDIYLLITCNVSAANAGWTIDGPWQVCSDGKSYFLNLREAGYLGEGGMTVRWDQEGISGTIHVPLTIRSADIDTSGTGDALFTVTLKECNDYERAYYQTWESDTLTNFSGAVTTETITVID